MAASSVNAQNTTEPVTRTRRRIKITLFNVPRSTRRQSRGAAPLGLPGFLRTLTVMEERGSKAAQNLGGGFQQGAKARFLDSFNVLPGMVHQLLQHVFDMMRVSHRIGGFDNFGIHTLAW